MIFTILSLFFLGIIVGTFGSFVGLGGGLILIPVFLMGMHYTPQNAVATSLVVVFFNAVSGTVAYIKQKKVYYNAAISFALSTIPGAFLGSYLVKYFDGSSFRLVFGIFLIMTAVYMFFKRNSTQNEPASLPQDYRYNRPLGMIFSVFVGVLSSLLGIGGGIIHVPLMIYILGFPTHIATATSSFILAVSSFSGVISHLLLNNILLVPAISIGIGAVVGAQLGAALSLRAKAKSIIVILCLAMIFVGSQLILQH
jgi:uncharacterized membrane protein YfcA